MMPINSKPIIKISGILVIETTQNLQNQKGKKNCCHGIHDLKNCSNLLFYFLCKAKETTGENTQSL